VIKINFFFWTGIFYILAVTFPAIRDIGKIPEYDPSPYDWSLVALVFAVVAVPFIVGYLAGRLNE
jgi:hypothetical protein